MSSGASSAKAKWNAANYAQVKVSVRPEIAAAFKAACAADGVSMAGKLSQFMAEYGATVPDQKGSRKTAGADPLSTKKKRTKTILGLMDLLEQVRDAEEQAMENTPENFRGSENFEASEVRISSMGEALDILDMLY